MKIEVLEYLSEEKSEEIPLLFVHGSFHGAWCWKENFLPYFASVGFPSYALSFKGHGQSEGKEDIHSFSLSDYLEDVLGIIYTLKKKPVLIGHSLGGAIVQKILQLHQEKVQAAVLMASAPPSGMWKEGLRLFFSHFKECAQMNSFFNGRKVEFPAKLFFSEELPVIKRSEYVGLLTQESRKATIAASGRIVSKSMIANVPMLILGSDRDVIISKKAVIETGKAYNSKPIIFPNMSHDMMLDPKWRAVAEQILVFLHESVIKDRGKEGA